MLLALNIEEGTRTQECKGHVEAKNSQEANSSLRAFKKNQHSNSEFLVSRTVR
jgi:hypothetical protein